MISAAMLESNVKARPIRGSAGCSGRSLRRDVAIKWLKRHDGTGPRSGRPGVRRSGKERSLRLCRALGAVGDFDISVAFCFTPEHLGLARHHRSAPIGRLHFADFCAEMIELHARAQRRAAVA